MAKRTRPRSLDHEDGTRTCTACGQRLPLDAYDLDSNATLGRRSHCKPCRSARMKAWYAANRERQAQRQAERFATNRDAIRLQDMARYERHKDKRIALVVEAGHRRRALKRGAPADRGITVTALRKRDGDTCCYCSCVMVFRVASGREFISTKATVEHRVALARGGSHTWDNVALACWQCNVRKNAADLDEWMAATPGGPASPRPL